MDILTEIGLVDEKTGSTWSQICLMAKSIDTSEFATCVAKDPWKATLLSFYASEHADEEEQFHGLNEKVSFHLQGDVNKHLKEAEDYL